jgi:3-oxoacyl-[acyl-carrier protein] reductase
MDLGLAGRVAVVGGASQGIGRATAEALAREGARLVVWARREPALAAAAAEIPDATGAEVVAVQGDVRRAEDHEKVVGAALDRFGRVDILVSNDGAPPLGLIEEFDDAAWDWALRQNLMSVVRLARLCLPSMRANRWGRIVSVTAISAKAPIAGFGLSVASWAGLLGFAKTLSREVAAEGITVNTICPGRIDTDLLKRSLRAQAEIEKRPYDAVVEDVVRRIPARRLGRPEEIAAVVAFLASDRAAYLTGTTIQVDGGVTESLV